jgi:hypothetical protein
VLDSIFRSLCIGVIACVLASCGREASVEPRRVAVRAKPSPPKAAPVARPVAARPPILAIRKCVGPDGTIAYQDEPCAEGAREAIHSVELMRATPSRADIVARAEREAAELAAIAHGGTGARISSGWNAANERDAARRRYCEEVRADVQRERDRNWRRLTMEYLRKLDERVNRACNA